MSTTGGNAEARYGETRYTEITYTGQLTTQTRCNLEIT